MIRLPCPVRAGRHPFLVVVVALTLGATLVTAQMELAVVLGTVKDDAGQPLAEVTFRLRDLERGRDTIIRSDKAGRFYRRGLQAVEYELFVEKEGYQPIHDKIRLTAGIDRRFDFKLVKAAPAGAEEFARGVQAFNSGNTAAAIEAFEAAVAKAPDLPEVRVNLALAYIRASRPADAVASLETAARLAPDDPRVQFQLGSAYIDLKDLDKAAAALEKGLARQPDVKDPLAYDGTVTLGAVYFARGDNDKAQAQFEKALAARPGAATPLVGLGKVHFSRGALDKALACFQQVVSDHPGTPEAAEATTFINGLKKSKGPGLE